MQLMIQNPASPKQGRRFSCPCRFIHCTCVSTVWSCHGGQSKVLLMADWEGGVLTTPGQISKLKVHSSKSCAGRPSSLRTVPSNSLQWLTFDSNIQLVVVSYAIPTEGNSPMKGNCRVHAWALLTWGSLYRPFEYSPRTCTLNWPKRLCLIYQKIGNPGTLPKRNATAC